MEKKFICIKKKEMYSENEIAKPSVVFVSAEDEKHAKLILKSKFGSDENGWLLQDDWYLIEEDYAKNHIAYAEVTK